ncbi:MAG: EAL domain-containing protein [Clostridia bacterium]
MYKLQITNKGKATSANLEFQKIFDISSTEDNIFIFKDEQFFVTPKDKLFKAPMIIIKCADRKKKMRYSLFIQNKLGISSSFYTGADFTNEIETVVKMQQRYETNESTGLYNTQVLKSNYDKWIADTTKGSLLIFLEMVNSQLYRALYGNGFHSRIMKEISKIIEKQLQCDKIYLIDDSILGVCYNGEKDREINYEIIKNCLILLNKTVAFGDGNDIAMPDIRFGVLDMTMAQLSYETAIRYAKIALDNAKRSEKSKIFIINGKESRRPTDFDAHGLLDLMIANNEIDVYYQPQIDTKTKKIVAFEALCRILSDKRNEITTFDFIRKAEIGGGLINLGKYIYFSIQKVYNELYLH